MVFNLLPILNQDGRTPPGLLFDRHWSHYADPFYFQYQDQLLLKIQKTNYRKEINLEETVKSIVEAAKEKDYETLKHDHIATIKVFFDRVQLNLG